MASESNEDIEETLRCVRDEMHTFQGGKFIPYFKTAHQKCRFKNQNFWDGTARFARENELI